MFGSLSAVAAEQGSNRGVTYRPDVTFTLRTDIGEGKLVFIGEAGAIAGVFAGKSARGESSAPDVQWHPGCAYENVHHGGEHGR